ncbi:hypothetical protein T11_3894 [Trichinella zimbabwensis]|uniref:Uncharacterized protein n=1 Tax=Trichinella zimbabwensis TaxID=268475 RepID=A0A0V1HEB0_9BILA|nr:hypothetical protein T11_3894 [Trichinella zimbabwensis]
MNQRRADKKLIVVMSNTTSKCTARVTMHVNRQMYAFCAGRCSSFTYNGPAKSNPTLLNGNDGVTLSGGRSLINGQNGQASCFRQMMQALMHLLTACRPRTSQKRRRKAAKVWFSPACNSDS